MMRSLKRVLAAIVLSMMLLMPAVVGQWLGQ